MVKLKNHLINYKYLVKLPIKIVKKYKMTQINKFMEYFYLKFNLIFLVKIYL